jgi:hypothetical protein
MGRCCISRLLPVVPLSELPDVLLLPMVPHPATVRHSNAAAQCTPYVTRDFPDLVIFDSMTDLPKTGDVP